MDIGSRLREAKLNHMQRPLSFLAVILTFLLTSLGAFLLLALWAQIFAGAWQKVNFQIEMPNALILSSAVASLVVVLRNLPKGKARMYLTVGLALIAVEVFLELPVKKYVSTFPATYYLIKWFFLFGMTEFVGMLLCLIGFREFMNKTE